MASLKVNPASRKRSMDEEGIFSLLRRADVGQFATVDADGKPYVIPVCFIFEDERIYFHCALKGKKLDNIRANSAACFSVFEVLGMGVSPDKPCNSYTYYRSVVASGIARLVDGREQRMRVLRLLSEKYAKGPVGEILEDSFGRTAVVEIIIDEISGKKNEKKV